MSPALAYASISVVYVKIVGLMPAEMHSAKMLSTSRMFPDWDTTNCKNAQVWRFPLTAPLNLLVRPTMSGRPLLSS
jgi:hypothetical protein